MIRLISTVIGALLITAVPTTVVRAGQPVIIFAAASLKTALDQSILEFQKTNQVDIKVSYGGSSTLARQIVQGAPADIFISADEQSMDEAAKSATIKPESRFDFLRNRLVVIAPQSAAITRVDLTPAAFSLILGPAGRLATGEVHSVPVGRYAKEALEHLGLWTGIEPRLAMTDNVRAALAFVAQAEAPLGIVYATDAIAEPKVRVVAVFPETSHAPILYPAAVTSRSTNDKVNMFLHFLQSQEGRRIFETQGFEMVQN